jgi:hypothetical protein
VTAEPLLKWPTAAAAAAVAEHVELGGGPAPAALTALSPVTKAVFPRTWWRCRLALTVPDSLSCPRLVIGWLGTDAAPALLFFQQ